MVECQICYKQFKKIAYKHLLKHNLTINEYKNIFPFSKIFDDEIKQKISKSLKIYMTDNIKKEMSNSRKGRIPWNKGKRRPDMMGDNNPARRPEVRKKLSGENNPAKRPEVRAKISKAKIGHGMSEDGRKKMSKNNGMKNPEIIKRAKETFRKNYRPENHYNWKNGKSFEPYCPKFTKNKREEIRNKYQRKCFACNKNENDNITKSGKIRKLSVHHIDMDKEQGCNGKSWRLVPLCLKCHKHKKER